MAVTVTVQYFASLREQAGCDREQVGTDAPTAALLYAELCARHGFPPQTAHLRVAINDAFVPWESPLAEGDRVVFIPPVAGG